jgi:hypothetical protein
MLKAFIREEKNSKKGDSPGVKIKQQSDVVNFGGIFY